MVLTLDRLAKIVAQEVGDRNKERLSEIKRYVQRTVTQVTKMLRKGPVYKTATITLTNGTATLPDDVFAVLSVYDSGSIFYEQVDNIEFRNREQRSSTMPTVQIFEDAPNWTLRILNATSNATISIDYLITTTDPSALPTYFEDLIVTGASAKYYLRRSTREKHQDVNGEYKDLLNQLKEEQQYNDRSQKRIKGIPEIEISHPGNSLLATGNSVMNTRGIY